MQFSLTPVEGKAPQPSIHPAILDRVSQADDERVIRALEARDFGGMEMNIIARDLLTVTARVTSTRTIGKRNPRVETRIYSVLLTPWSCECTCPDSQYRGPDGVVCKHVIYSVVALQEHPLASQGDPP